MLKEIKLSLPDEQTYFNDISIHRDLVYISISQLFPDNNIQFDIFSLDGTYLYQSELEVEPDRIIKHVIFKDDYIYMVYEDTMNINTLVKYRTEFPGK